MSMATEQVGFPRVRGVCPSCGSRSLFLGAGGYITCAVVGSCDNPCAVSDLLSERIHPDRLAGHHVVTVKATGWYMTHPLSCDLARCKYDAIAQIWTGAPADLGRYAWHELGDDPHQWTQIASQA